LRCNEVLGISAVATALTKQNRLAVPINLFVTAGEATTEALYKELLNYGEFKQCAEWGANQNVKGCRFS